MVCLNVHYSGGLDKRQNQNMSLTLEIFCIHSEMGLCLKFQNGGTAGAASAGAKAWGPGREFNRGSRPVFRKHTERERERERESYYSFILFI